MRDGISEELAEQALQSRTIAGGDIDGLGFAFYNGTLHVLADPAAFVMSYSAQYLLVYVAVLQEATQAFGSALPDGAALTARDLACCRWLVEHASSM